MSDVALIDGYWLPIGRFSLAVGYDRETVRRMAERGELEATYSERGHLLLAARHVQKLRHERAIEHARHNLARTLISATMVDGNGRPVTDLDAINSRFSEQLIDAMRAQFPGVPDEQLLGRRA
jgi:hypothetical protein